MFALKGGKLPSQLSEEVMTQRPGELNKNKTSGSVVGKGTGEGSSELFSTK